MSTNSLGDGVESVATDDGIERDARGWPILRANKPCDSSNPMTGRDCVSGDHRGYHRDANGAEWLDD